MQSVPQFLLSRRWVPLLLFGWVVGMSWLWGHWQLTPPAAESALVMAIAPTTEPVVALPESLDLDPLQVALGEALFHDPRLSGDNTISCATCHLIHRGGVDRLPTSVGSHQRQGTVNAPTVLNSAFNFRQFWDGRAESLEEQVDGPIHAAHEMNSSWPEIIAKLQQDPDYRRQFRKVYQSARITPNGIRQALATYERSLITPHAPFDRYLQGDKTALSPPAQAGYQRFKDYGCISCHQGVNLGGNLFQRFGILGDYFADRGRAQTTDLGRYNITGNPNDRYVFKVPSLRNVALTAPYFHDGSVTTLAEAVAIMGRYQLGRSLEPDDIDQLVQFLVSLTGDQPEPPASLPTASVPTAPPIALSVLAP